jgi:hypothetical protein
MPRSESRTAGKNLNLVLLCRRRFINTRPANVAN